MKISHILDYYQDAQKYCRKNIFSFHSLYLKYDIKIDERKKFKEDFLKMISFFSSGNQPELMKKQLSMQIIFQNHQKVVFYILVQNKKMFKAFFHLKNHQIDFKTSLEVVEKLRIHYQNKKLIKKTFKAAITHEKEIKSIICKRSIDYLLEDKNHNYHQLNIEEFILKKINQKISFTIIHHDRKRTLCPIYFFKLYHRQPFQYVNKNIKINSGIFFLQYQHHYLFRPSQKEIIQINIIINNHRENDQYHEILIGDCLDNEWSIQ